MELLQYKYLAKTKYLSLLWRSQWLIFMGIAMSWNY